MHDLHATIIKTVWLHRLLVFGAAVMIVLGLKRVRYDTSAQEERDTVWAIADTIVRRLALEALLARISYRKDSQAMFYVAAAILIASDLTTANVAYEMLRDLKIDLPGHASIVLYSAAICMLLGLVFRFSEINPRFTEDEFKALLVKFDDEGNLIPRTKADIERMRYEEVVNRSEHQRSGLRRGRLWSVRSFLLTIAGLVMICITEAIVMASS